MELNESSESSAEVLDENLNISTKILNDYEVVSVIGNGSFGTCFKVREKATGNFFAWKGIDYDEFSDSQRELLISEIRVLRQLQHPNIVQYYNHLINPEAKSLFIVMEYCEGGDLAQWIAKARVERKRFEELYIWRILYQICRALQICHNKIKDGTILHRDIKPANIFLDANGNAKLGDFGLARMLRRNETFAETFVGTPYYMSPEIVKGNKYDRKSDVWAVGCLIYEMCALCPPFKGREFSQLSTNIKIGKYNKISSVYSENLQNIIKFMLEVENDQRPKVQRKLDFSSIRDSSHIHLIKRKSLDDKSYGKGLNIAGMLTPDLRAEIFYSTKREIYAMAPKLQHSDPELYESIKHETLDPRREQRNSFKKNNTLETKPELLTKEVFGDALKVRLHAIRAQESLLRQKEESLDIREKQLNEKECRLLQLEDNLLEKSRLLFKEMEKLSLANNSFSNANILSSQLENAATLDMPPPLPPRKSTLHDETYCSIESNEVTLLHEPTMAKLDLNTLPAPKAFSNTRARKVTFQSPKNFIRYDIENNAIKKQQKMQTSVSSKGSEGSSEGTNSVNCPKQRRKSLFSILGFNRNNKENIDAMSKSNPSHSPHKKVLKNAITTIKEQISISEEKILSKCETAELSNIWTKDHKRAAFEMLAVMNGANVSHGNTSRHKLRHSARERNILHHNRLRRSFMAPM
uniref:non-specific serine/threonine protein kinase n=1 Tax=Glossina brevipalpis TaxID=37001 RepID=A0A1A9W953_9MUSC